ncbi:hypothetical protein FHW88_002776 [Mucilaginibacter sp. SG538B]|uniref:hypothetical protein n=1 Tax=Mucilaginibacter sp. SG538B TaxID=2587021 RepID=UPI00159D6873|nr:hypothetical protein [Mucilaginibacter sp. SG538B]NVM64487.1 hypothetical protein [Mucilaginibacter sp. SG538B]
MNIDCIIDTSSCIVLSNSEFQQTSLLSHLKERSNFQFSHEVEIELNDHRDKGLPSFLFRGKKTLSTRLHTIEEYEKRMVGKPLTSRVQRKLTGEPKNNKGEIDNYAVAIDQVHHIKRSGLIYITDDKKAINSFATEYSEAFPAIRLWTSFDVLLFLYADSIIPSRDIALEMLQSLISFTARNMGNHTEKTTNELTKKRMSYVKRIDLISKLIK